MKIPDSELSWRFSRSSGPGGQYVNTTDTRVELIWTPTDSRALTPSQQQRVAVVLAARMSGEQVIVTSSRFRSQTRNRDDARRRLEELVTDALRPPRARRPSRPTSGSVERRLAAKRRRSDRKKERRTGWD